MAAAPQIQALEVVKDKILQVDDRYDEYHRDLTEALHDIMALVNDHPHNIAQQMSRRIAALGELLVKNEGSIQ